MLGKLAVRNTKRSLKDYLIYLITITISFSLILAYNLVASSNEVVELSSGMETFKTILTFVNVITSVVSSCFGKYESTGCNICHIGNDGGISYNWYMVGEP